MTRTTKRILWGGALLIVAGAAQPLRPMVVVGPSMAPTYSSWEVLWTVPVDRPLRHGDVVVADGPSGPMIKRVALLPGDRRQQWHTRSGWTDTTTLCVPRHPRSPRTIVNTRTLPVPSGMVFLLGDNLQASIDSRAFGPVPIKSVRRLVLGAREPDDKSGMAKIPPQQWIAGAIKARSL